LEELFEKTWEKYLVLKGKFSAKVKLHSIHYDDEINKIFESWQKQAEDLKKGLSTSPVLQGEAAVFTDAVDKATAAKDQADWRYTHLMDLLMFVGSPTIQDRLVTYVGRQIIELIQERGDDDEMSLIAHSMGCAMAHKALQALYNEGVEMPNGSRQTVKGDFSFVNISMVANTSYALSRDRAEHYHTIVRPSSKVGDGCCFSWINVNHVLDPVGRFVPFDCKEPNWRDPVVAAAGLLRDIPLDLVSSRDIHSLTHYFRDPSLHIPFFELAFDPGFTTEQKSKAIEAYKKETIESAFKTLISHLESEVLDVSKTESFKKLFEALRAFFALTK